MEQLKFFLSMSELCSLKEFLNMEDSSEEFDDFEGGSSTQCRAQSNEGENPEENVDDENVDDENDQRNEKQKKRAPVWKHFEEFVDENGQIFTRCKHKPCSAQYALSGKSNSSTGNMIKHMNRNHREIYSLDTVEAEEAFMFSQDKFRQALLKWVVMCDQPFSAIKDETFIDLVKTLNPLAHIVCDKTIRADLMVEYEKKKQELKVELVKVPGKISITLDGWTSKHGLPFLAIRGHWIDENWELKSKLLDFAYIDGDHDGHNHSVILTECLSHLEVPFSKILAITGDNAGSNDTLFDWLDDYGISAVTSKVRCLAHVINLAAQDMMAVLKVPSHSDYDSAYDQQLENEVLQDIDLDEEIDDEELGEGEEESEGDVAVAVVVKIRKLIRKVRKSAKLRQKVNKLCIVYNVKYLVAIIDVVTRWNSSFDMLSRAEYLKLPLMNLCINEKGLNHLRITSTEWDVISTIKTILVKFDRATKFISMARHSTISAYLPTLDWLIVSLRKYVAENSGCVADAVQMAVEKLEKYELDVEVSLIPFVGIFLNPALKMNYVKEHDKYSNADSRQIQKSISEYFEEQYVKKAPKRRLDDSENDNTDDDLKMFMFKRSKVEKNSKEINKYLQLPLEDKGIDVFDYWKAHSKTFPALADMARDFFAVQSGSVSVERDFAGAVDLITPTRCSLVHSTIRSVMCVKSWYKS